MNSNYDIIVIGGGAAGFFAAINIVEKANASHQKIKIAIVERGKEVLSKVKISGGGRCNVTHACFVPNDLVKYYPRGEMELKGPFHQFCTGDTIDWFKNHDVILKIEDDGRMFPVSNTSQTIIDCFLNYAHKFGIDILTSHSIQSLYNAENYWELQSNQELFICKKVVVATGSSLKIWEILKTLGHTIIEPVPSLFTFNISDFRIQNLMGISTEVSIRIKNSKLLGSGPILITHWGISGPVILRISAWGARELADYSYQFVLLINWLQDTEFSTVLQDLKQVKLSQAKKVVAKNSPFDLPTRLWESLVIASGIRIDEKWADLSKLQLHDLGNQLTNGEFQVNGKSTFKDEFVTAGGINLKEVNFKTLESKVLKNVYFAGEVLNIDAITGGFNFQNAWTTGFIAANNILVTD